MSLVPCVMRLMTHHPHLHQPWRLDRCNLITHRAIITDALGGELEFEFFHAWFNTIFLTAALATAGLLYAQHQRARDPDLPLYHQDRRE